MIKLFSILQCAVAYSVSTVPSTIGQNVVTGGNTDAFFDSNQLASTFRLLSAVLFVVGGLVYLAWASGRVPITKSIIHTGSAAASSGIFVFIALDAIDSFSVSVTTLTIAVLVAASLAGFLVMFRNYENIGKFGLGSLFGFVLAVLGSQILGTVLETAVARFSYLFVVSAGIGFIIMKLDEKWEIISAVVAGSFSFIHGLDFFVFRSNFSRMVRVALNGDKFAGFDQDTTIAFCVFLLLSFLGIFLNKDKILK